MYYYLKSFAYSTDCQPISAFSQEELVFPYHEKLLSKEVSSQQSLLFLAKACKYFQQQQLLNQSQSYFLLKVKPQIQMIFIYHLFQANSQLMGMKALCYQYWRQRHQLLLFWLTLPSYQPINLLESFLNVLRTQRNLNQMEFLLELYFMMLLYIKTYYLLVLFLF